MAAPIGTLTQKMLRQPTELTRRPPTTGPHAAATPKIPDQMPRACARSFWSWNVFLTIEQGRDDEQVGVGNPLQPRDGGVQVLLQRRQRNIQNCVIYQLITCV
jgi:hypothetical protein